MSVIRIGSNKQYADGWELVFGGRRGKKTAGHASTSKSASKGASKSAKSGKARKSGSGAAHVKAATKAGAAKKPSKKTRKHAGR